MFKPVQDWTKEVLRTLMFVRKDVVAYLVNQTNKNVTTIMLKNGLYLYNIYRLAENGSSGPIIKRVTAIFITKNQVIARDFNKARLWIAIKKKGLAGYSKIME